jgi:hypothetical protein
MDYKNQAFDIIIEGGQSNASGSGWGEVENEYILDEDILYLTIEKKTSEGIKDGIWSLFLEYSENPLQISVASECDSDGRKIGDFALTFAKSYKEKYLTSGRKILIIRAGVGGTGFMRKHWGVGDLVYEKMIQAIDYALSLNHENKLIAFLWHQGEHDAFEGNIPNVFATQLTEMLNSVRERYNASGLPFISGDFVNEWKTQNIEICEPIVAKIKEVTALANGEFVETSDLLSNNQKNGGGDGIHFCRDALHELGRRYFSAYEKIVGGRK